MQEHFGLIWPIFAERYIRMFRNEVNWWIFVWTTNLVKSSSRTPAPPPPTSLPSSPHAASYPLLVSSLLDVDRLLLLGGLNRCPQAGQGRRERFVWNEIFVDLQRDWSPPCCWFDWTLPARGFCGTLCGHRWLRGNFIKSDLTLSLAYDDIKYVYFNGVVS